MIQSRWWTSLILALLTVTSAVVAQDDAQIKPDSLFAASRNGNLEQVKAALDSGLDVNSKTEYGATALFFACGM